ncbi:MAG: YkgB family protein [Acidobacteriaceae bacterium]
MDFVNVASADAIPARRVAVLDGANLEGIGGAVSRYGVAVVLIWIGCMKFTAYEAMGITPLVSHSPFFAWMLSFMEIRTLSAGIGVVEIVAGLLITSRRISPRASAIGSFLAGGTFLITLSFLLSTPGVWAAPAGGFPALSASPGQFLIKDIVLLGASIWSLGEAMKHIRRISHIAE